MVSLSPEMSIAKLQRRMAELACYSFQPRPDQPTRHDQQTAFYNSQHAGVSFLLGGNGAGTTTLGLAKAVKFMTCDQPPPRKDTPFWIIAGSYQQVMGACWKEKLHQQGHLHPNDVDWQRIQWYKPNNDWPFTVHLKPWRGRPGKNWSISFKSYEQGRAAMQAESIGGFLFVEQFPWGILEETLRGCREYAFTGNKLAEFTPVDPALSMELREMEENSSLPEDWAIYRANTRCAMEAGHVTKQWYNTFFGMVPDQMKPVRESGLWGGFEGAIYPEFNSQLHCTPLDYDIPPACYHSRAIDYGFSADHAFVCLWGCRDGSGRWIIYDEYYSTDTSKTVVDHYMEIQDRHPWPQNNPYYGTTWVDHNLDCVRIASRMSEYAEGYDSMNVQLAHKNVDEGIEYVKMLLKPTINMIPGEPMQPRLKIDRKRCPNLMREMVSYRRQRQVSTGPNAAAPKDAPVKSKDDAVDAMRYLVFSEANQTGTTVSTMAHEHSGNRHGVQIESKKINRQRTVRR